MEALVSLFAYILLIGATSRWLNSAHTRSGAPFLHRMFQQNAEFSRSANQLVTTGMTLIALGAGAILCRGLAEISSWTGATESVAEKFGLFLLFVAGIHLVRFDNLIKAATPRPTPLRAKDQGHCVLDLKSM